MCSESPRDAAHSTDASECSPETEMKLPTINATPSSLLRSTLSRLQDSLPSTSVRQPGVLLRTPNDKQTQQNSIWEECLAAGIEGCRRFDRGGPRPNPASPAGLSSGLQRQPPGPVRTRQLRRRGASGRKGPDAASLAEARHLPCRAGRSRRHWGCRRLGRIGIRPNPSFADGLYIESINRRGPCTGHLRLMDVWFRQLGCRN